MPQVDYNKCVIYKIQHKELDELLYVGSTTHFRNRKVRHKSNCYKVDGSHYNLKLYTKIRDNGGWDAFNMVIVKEFPCENKRQAEAEEDKVMREMKSSLNMVRAYTTPEERREQHSITNKVLYQNNIEKIKEKSKKYYENNKEKISERGKVYRVKNIDRILNYGKEWREKNKDKMKEYDEQKRERDKEKIKCECGCEIRKCGLAKHLKTLKHQEYLNQQTDQ